MRYIQAWFIVILVIFSQILVQPLFSRFFLRANLRATGYNGSDVYPWLFSQNKQCHWAEEVIIHLWDNSRL